MKSVAESGQRRRCDTLGFVVPAGQAIEKGVDTQCLLLRYGKLAVVSFRGTQPVSFFGW